MYSVLSRRYLLNHSAVFNQTWYGCLLLWSGVYCRRQKKFAVFKVNVTALVQNVCECLSRWYLLNRRTFCYQTWYGDAASRTILSCRKKLFPKFKVKVTLRAHMNKIWLSNISSELLVLGNQTWSNDTSSEARVSHEKDGLLLSRSRSQPIVTMSMHVQMISSKTLHFLSLNVVLWCIIMSQSVLQKDWFTIFNVKVTAKAPMIKVWQFLLYLLNCSSFFKFFFTKLGLIVHYHKLVS